MTTQPLSTPPAGFAAGRDAAHRLAVYVISPARRRVTERIGLRASPGGFTTPPYGGDERVRLDADRIVRERSGAADSRPVTTLTAAADFVLGGAPDVEWAQGFDVPPLGDPDEPLALDPASGAFLGAWFGFAFDVLGELHEEMAANDPNEIQLWPEHFDAAFDADAAGGRITFGASPGDVTSDEPYLYVLPPVAVPRGEVWNAAGFAGAVLPLSGFVDAADQRAAALVFMRGRHAAVASP